jgi:hypothetical protein
MPRTEVELAIYTDRVLFLRELHSVRGAQQLDFEALYRDGWQSRLRENGLGRLLWFLDQAHGSGLAYRAVTITAINDGAAWEELARRVQRGDLSEWAHEADRLRYHVDAALLAPVAWSPLQPAEIEDQQTAAAAGVDPVLYMEDTVSPHPGRVDDYIAAAGDVYTPSMASRGLLSLRAAFRATTAGGHRGEVVLLQRIDDQERLLALLANETAPEHHHPDSWMRRALAWRDTWRSGLLRTAPWSPLR